MNNRYYDALGTLTTRQIDLLIAEQVLGYEVRKIKPSWYPHEVTLFFVRGHPHVVYSYDENSCNAIMYANGVNDEDGVARSLPHYSSDIQEAWEICERMKDNDYFGASLETLYKTTSEKAARKICEEALRSVRWQKETDALTVDQREENAVKNVLGD